MGGIQSSTFVVLSLFSVVAASATGCLMEDEAVDLARNPYIYKVPEYEAPRKTSQSVFVERLIDERTTPDVNQGSSFRQIYSDGEWDRTVPVMVEELLVEAVEHSGIYAGQSVGSEGKPKPGDIVIVPTLLEMFRMREVLTGDGSTGHRRTVAVASLRLKVLAAEDGAGQRKLLLDEVFREAVATKPSLAKPERGISLAGQAMHQVVQRMLIKLYESNASRTRATGEPSPASGSPDSGRTAPGAGAEKPDGKK